MANEATNPDPPKNIHGKERRVRKVQDESTKGNTVTTTDRLVPHGTDPEDAEFGILSSEIYDSGNVNKSRRRDTVVDTDDLHTLPGKIHKGLEDLGAVEITTNRSLVDITLGLDSLTTEGHLVIEDQVQGLDRVHGDRSLTTVEEWREITIENQRDPRAGGERTVELRQVVQDADAWPTEDVETIELSRTEIGPDKFLQVNLRAEDGWPTLVSYEEEPTTGKLVTVTRSVLTSAPVLDTDYEVDGTPRFVESIREASKEHWAKTVREIEATILTDTWIEWHNVDFYFPAYLDEDDPFLVQDIGDSTIINALKSSDLRVKVPCKFEITYHTAAQTASEIFQFKPVDIHLNTPYLNVYEDNIITDGATITFRVPNEPYYGTGGFQLLTFSFPASSPTTTEWKAMMAINEEKLIADESTRWKYNLYKRVKVYLRMPDLRNGLDGSLYY